MRRWEKDEGMSGKRFERTGGVSRTRKGKEQFCAISQTQPDE
jgi:hypothetical protein